MEIRKDIPGYEGLYQASNMGQIKSLGREILKNGKYKARQKGTLLKTREQNGYLYLSLFNSGKGKKCTVHRLIGYTFLKDTFKKGLEINHKNGIRNDNKLENLEWCTHSENGLHSFRELGRISFNKGKFGCKNPNSKGVIQYTLKGEIIRKRKSIMDIKREMGINNGHIGRVCSGHRKTAGGYKRKYL